MRRFSHYVYELIDYMKRYLGKDIDEIADLVGFKTNAKNKNNLVLSKLAHSFQGEDFFKTLLEEEYLNFKTVNLNKKGKPEESMSFPAFSFKEIIREDWETSTLRKTLSRTFVFVIIQRDESGNRFKDVFLWEMPEEDLEGEVREVWGKTKSLIEQGMIVKNVEDPSKLHFPQGSETRICHVRPHGRNAMDVDKLPVADQKTNYLGATRQSFWLNKAYIYEIISKNCQE